MCCPDPNLDSIETRVRKRQLNRGEDRQKIVTLEDVAKMAGVTSMTVSRVIKGKGYVAAATREKVLRIAEELNYTANPAARALATGQTGTIAIISGTINQHYYANIVHLLESQLVASGYQMRLLHTRSALKDLINATKASAVDGVIIAGMYHLVEEFLALDPKLFQPCVFIDTLTHPFCDHVHVNLRGAVEEALELMISSGRKRIAYIGNFESESLRPTTVSEVRMRTYISQMEAAGRTPEMIGVNPHTPLPERTRLLRDHLQNLGCPDAMLCQNDETAIHVYRTLLDLGYRIPQDVLLAGCDGLPYMEFFEPPLSTIVQPMEEICERAWKFLQARMANPAISLQSATLDAQLVIRGSLKA